MQHTLSAVAEGSAKATKADRRWKLITMVQQVRFFHYVAVGLAAQVAYIIATPVEMTLVVELW